MASVGRTTRHIAGPAQKYFRLIMDKQDRILMVLSPGQDGPEQTVVLEDDELLIDIIESCAGALRLRKMHRKMRLMAKGE